jgi:hypothetical protein
LLVNAIARISRGASSIADNIKAFNESPGAQAAIAVLKIIKNLACARCKKLGYGEGVDNVLNSSAMVLCAPRFDPPGHFEAVGDCMISSADLHSLRADSRRALSNRFHSFIPSTHT